MASRRLAFNLQQSLRSRAALRSVQPLTRGLATPVNHGSKTESTTLSNGFTVWNIYYRAMEHQLINLADRYGAFTLGSDVDGWRLD